MMKSKRTCQASRLTVGEFTVDVERKNIRNMHLAVYPGSGRIRVSAPRQYGDEAIRQFVVAKSAWIHKHLSTFRTRGRVPETEYVAGEIHWLEGKGYLLSVAEDAAVNRIELMDDERIRLYIRPGTDRAKREQLFKEWHQARLGQRLGPLIGKWQEIMGVKAESWRVRQMKTRWGSCSIARRRITFSLALAGRADRCLEYVVVHELAHLLERGHGAVFKGYMDSFLPDWRVRREELKKPLGRVES